MDIILKKYNVVGDELFYHRTVTEPFDGIYTVGPEVHRQFEVYYLIRGKISYVIEGRTYTPQPGDIIIAAPSEVHTLRIDGSETYERGVVLFDMDIMRELLSRIKIEPEDFFLGENHRFHIIERELVEKYRLGEVLLSIIDTEGDGQYKKLIAVSRLIEFLARLDLMAGSDGLSLMRPSSEDALVRRAVHYIDGHIGERMTLDGIADALFVSKSTLCHRFAEYMSISITKYINIRKINYAAELVRRGAGATEAAARVGFDNYASFYYNYKKIIGVPPTDGKRRLKP